MRRIETSASFSDQETRALTAFSKHYNITFHRPDLLQLALTHRSYLSVTGRGPRDSNERLEFLGDSVLGLVTSEFLYRTNPHEHEGQLTKTKSLLVSKAILSRRALAMGLGRFVLMSQSEVESGGRQRMSILADAFESVVGAIYLDQGFEAARTFITEWLLRDAGEIAADKRHMNYKSHLQEYVQSTFRTHPTYRIRSEMGPDHSKQFNVDVVVGRRVLGTGRGPNKKEAEQAAARDALEGVAPKRGGSGVPTVEERDERSERRSRRGRGERRREGVRRDVEGWQDREPEVRRGREAETPRPREARLEPAPRRAAEPRREPVRHAESRPAFEPRRGGRDRGRGGRRPEPQPVETAMLPPAEIEVSPPELEPLPPAHEEDDFEEIGRPEGPVTEGHVDPYTYTPTPAASRPGNGLDRSASYEAPAPDTFEEPTPSFEDSPSTTAVAPSETFVHTPEREAKEPSPLSLAADQGGAPEPNAGPTESQPRYGRRSRGRRGRR